MAQNNSVAAQLLSETANVSSAYHVDVQSPRPASLDVADVSSVAYFIHGLFCEQKHNSNEHEPVGKCNYFSNISPEV